MTCHYRFLLLEKSWNSHGSAHPQQACTSRHSKQGDDAYFDGVIAKDNGDATYQVDFDDGDVLSAAPRRDIRLISMPDIGNDDPQGNEVISFISVKAFPKTYEHYARGTWFPNAIAELLERADSRIRS